MRHMQYTLICWVSTEHFHLSCLKAFDQMLSHQWLIIRNQPGCWPKHNEVANAIATIACTALVLDINKVGIDLLWKVMLNTLLCYALRFTKP